MFFSSLSNVSIFLNASFVYGTYCFSQKLLMFLYAPLSSIYFIVSGFMSCIEKVPCIKDSEIFLLFSSTVVKILLFNITFIALSEIDFSAVWIFITFYPQRLTSFLSIICWIANLSFMNLKYYITKMLKIHVKLR